jgi:hypothetical protein
MEEGDWTGVIDIVYPFILSECFYLFYIVGSIAFF